MCLSGITSDNSRLPCYPASLLEFFLAYVAIVSSHFHCGILSHPGACDPGPAGTTLIRVLRLRSGAARRTRRRRRSGWHRISQPGTCRWRDNTNKVRRSTWKHDTGSTVPVRYGVLFNQRAWSRGMKFQRLKKWVNLNHLNLSVWTEPLPVAPSKTPSLRTITEKRFMSAVMQSRGQFVSSHFDCSSYTMQGKKQSC